MIVHKINIKRVSIFKAKHDPPVAGDSNAPMPFPFPAQGVKAIPRQVEIRRVMRLVQVRKNILDPPHLVSSDAAWIAALKQAFQTLCRNVFYIRIPYLVSVRLSMRIYLVTLVRPHFGAAWGGSSRAVV